MIQSSMTCDQCKTEIDERWARFSLTYFPSRMSTIPYRPSTADYCSADCLLAAMRASSTTGMICGYEHSMTNSKDTENEES